MSFFNNLEQTLLEFLTAFAYNPSAFYGTIIIIMTLSTFGLPISEEIIIISASLVAYMGAHPEIYPPPFFVLEKNISPVTAETTALVCFLSVFLSDLLVYMLGFIFREKILQFKVLRKLISQKRKNKINYWINKYGFLTAALFRFTPGLRFIGYLTCGVIRIPILTFILINGGVALLVIPTQVFLISIYGEPITKNIKWISIGFVFIFVISVSFFSLSFLYKKFLKQKNK